MSFFFIFIYFYFLFQHLHYNYLLNYHEIQIYFFYDIETLNDLWNLTQRFNKTAWICAVDEGHKEIVELLMRQKDIDVNIQDI